MNQTLSIVIPAFNEELRLPPTLREIEQYQQTTKRPCQTIVVDDGSTDATCQIVKKIAEDFANLELLACPKNLGKGSAVRCGIQAANNDLILFTDADGSTPISEVERLEKQIKEGCDIAIGSRALPSHETKIETIWYRRLLGRLFHQYIRLVLLSEYHDTQCGFKLFTKSAAKQIFTYQRANGFSFDFEILYIAKKLGLKVVEVPVNWHNVPGSKVNLIIDALKMMRDALVFRWRHRKL